MLPNKGRQRLSHSFSLKLYLFTPGFIVHFVHLKLLRAPFFLVDGRLKNGPKIPEILFEIRSKKNLEQNLPFGVWGIIITLSFSIVSTVSLHSAVVCM